jgi:ADP-ribose pyrophosphatase YjhB (NUDIX family)
VVVKDNQILLVRQAEGHPLQGQWTIPWGFLDHGESPSEAALRETIEESGVNAKIDGLLGIQDLPPPWRGWLALVFFCRHVQGTPTPDGRETSAARYFSLAGLAELPEPVEEWCDWLARKVLTGDCAVVQRDPGNPYEPNAGYL